MPDPRYSIPVEHACDFLHLRGMIPVEIKQERKDVVRSVQKNQPVYRHSWLHPSLKGIQDEVHNNDIPGYYFTCRLFNTAGCLNTRDWQDGHCFSCYPRSVGGHANANDYQPYG